MTAIAFLLACAGFASLALAIPRHFREVFGREPAPRAGPGLRTAGWALLAVSLAACLSAWRASVGLVLWCGILSVAGVLVALLIAWRARTS